MIQSYNCFRTVLIHSHTQQKIYLVTLEFGITDIGFQNLVLPLLAVGPRLIDCSL